MQGAMAPEWNGAARGVFSGLSLAHGRGHLTRAILEGSAFALRDVLEAMAGAGLPARRLTVVSGGARSRLWCQIRSDVTGLPVRTPSSPETTATGAAILAAVAAGIYPDVHTCASQFVSYNPREHAPDKRAHAIYEQAYAIYRSTYFGLKPVFTLGSP
jgi:xylulokinase